MEFRVRFRPQNTPDYPELSMVIDINDQELYITSWTSDIDKERQILEKAAELIRKDLPNKDIISIERLY